MALRSQNGAQMEPQGGQKGANGSKMEPKGGNREAKGSQWEPKGSKKIASGTQKGAQEGPSRREKGRQSASGSEIVNL